MDNISISLSESGRGHDISRVRVDGVVDTLTAGELEEVMVSLLKRNRFKIVIDLAGVEYISSAGWGIFISHIKDVRANGGDIKLANMVSDVHEIFELLEFENVLQAHNSVEEAVDSFGGSTPPMAEGARRSRAIKSQTLVEQIPISDSSDEYDYGEQDQELTRDDITTAICRAVKEDPFASIGEIKQDLNSRMADYRVSRWQVFSVLRRKGLLTRKSRFRYAWRS